MFNVETIQNIHHEVRHTEQDANSFVKDGIVVKVETERAQRNGYHVMKSMNLVPFRVIVALDPTVINPSGHPKEKGKHEWQPRVIGIKDPPKGGSKV